MPQVNTQNQALILVAELAEALGRTGEWFEQFSLEGLGIALPAVVINHSSVQTALDQSKAAASTIKTTSSELVSAIRDEDVAKSIISLLGAADGIRLFSTHMIDLVGQLKNRVQADVSNIATKTFLLTQLDSIGAKIFNRQLALQIHSYSPDTLYFLAIVGLADWRQKTAELPGEFLSRPYIDQSVHLERLKDIIDDPAAHFSSVHGWGSPGFDPTPFLQLYRRMLGPESGVVIGTTPGGDPFLRHGQFYVQRSAINGKTGLTFETSLEFSEGIDEREKISVEWGTQLEAAFSLKGRVGLELTPPFDIKLSSPEASAGGKLGLSIDRNPTARPWSIIETGGLLTLSIENTRLGTGIAAELESAGNLKFEPRLFAELSQAKLKIGSEDGDSFLAKIIAGAELEAVFDLAFEFIPSKGLVVRAAGGVEIQIPIHRDLGPLRLDTFYLGLLIKDDGTLDLETSLGLGANLGPMKAVVERMGAKSLTKFTDKADEEFGGIGSRLAFKPPTGIGLSLDVGVVKGGGYLYIDIDRGEYAGALELTFSEWIALKAIGLISTRMPDGSNGFSLLIIITVEFAGGIQLGFGFTLIGVGGLLGLNRRTDIEPLAASIRTGAIESVMFPQNVIENAPRIISDLRAFFPAEEGTFLIGPMVKIGWGTPTLISLSMGIIIEVPDPTITILGVLKVALPTEEAAVLKLQVNFIGRIEFSNKLAWFYAELYDSRVLFITLEGGLGVLVNWSENSNFVVSAGGFHPDFNAPPLPFPEPPRIAASLLDTQNARIRIEGYFAVTSNSVQFGARAELFFGLSEFKIEGHLSFDALFIFSPFFFSFSLSVRLSVKVFGIGLYTVGFSGKLEGPTPWYIKGKGSISLLFFDIDVPFEHTWGERKNTDLPPIAVLPLLEQELQTTSNWTANLPAGVHTLVSLRQLGDGESDELVLHPVGSLSISQRKVPLGITLEKFGNQKPNDVQELTVGVTAGLNKLNDLNEQFALGHFKDLKEEEKLSKPAFQPMNSGIDLSVDGDQTQTSAATARTMRYERILIDGAFRRRIREAIIAFLKLLVALLNLSRRNAIRQSAISATRQAELNPLDQAISLRPDQYTVVLKADNRPAGAIQTVTFDNQVMAEDYLAREKRNNPAAAASLHVVPAVEANIRA